MGSGQASYQSKLILTQSPPSLPGTVQPPLLNYAVAEFLGNGTALDQCDIVSAQTLALAAAPVALNLFDGSGGQQITDLAGAVTSMARCKAWAVYTLATNNSWTLLVGYASSTSHAWTAFLSNPGQLTVQPATLSSVSAGFQCLAPNTTGWAVTSTNKLLNLDPGGNTFNVVALFAGCSV